MKLCVACKTYHPKSEFKAAHRDFPTRDGLNYNCIKSSKDHREEIEGLVDALEELIDLMEDTLQGEYTPDSFTTQPARIALAVYRKGGE